MRSKYFFIDKGFLDIKVQKIRMGIIYYGGTTIPLPETDSFYGGGQIYLKVSELKCRFLQDADHQGVIPTTKHHTTNTSFSHQ